MLAEDVSGVDVAADVMELDHLGCHRFPCVVVREGMVSLGEARVWDGAALDHQLIVTEEV